MIGSACFIHMECYNETNVTMNALKPFNVYLALGSNLGDRAANLKEALKLITERMRVVKVSTVYETEPEAGAMQPRYLNQVGQFTTTLPPEELLTLLKGFEQKLGRRSASGEPREIDIDIIFYDNRVINTRHLVIPHPRLTKRAFVLLPLVEIAPELIHPLEHKTVKELCEELEDRGGFIEKTVKQKKN